MKLADKLIKEIIRKKSPIVIGLDPVIDRMPIVYFDQHNKIMNEFEKISEAIIDFNKDIIDAICELVPAIKPQIAFYEMYGSYGIRAFEKTVEYAKSKGLIVVEDGKRNDIGNTALAYAKGHLGKVETTKKEMSGFDVDFLTVSPYLGYESLEPFISVCNENDKGLFILVKTSNIGNGVIQDVLTPEGSTVSQEIAKYINKNGDATLGEYGYSAIGAVVGATYPEEAKVLRQIMPKSIFLVPGYGTQGASAKDIRNCFDNRALGAIVNASRSILYGYEHDNDRMTISRDLYCESIIKLTKAMRAEIYTELVKTCTEIAY